MSTNTDHASIEYDPFTDNVMRDPWPYYAALRRDAPVFYLEKYDTWFLSRFEDIRQSTINDVFTAERGVTPEMVLLKEAPPVDPVFSMLDMPRQREYRRVFSPRYSRRAIGELEDGIRRRTRQLLEPLIEQGGFDAYRDLANPVSSYTIAELIGLPEEEALELRGLVQLPGHQRDFHEAVEAEGVVQAHKCRQITGAYFQHRLQSGQVPDVGAFVHLAHLGQRPQTQIVEL